MKLKTLFLFFVSTISFVPAAFSEPSVSVVAVSTPQVGEETVRIQTHPALHVTSSSAMLGCTIESKDDALGLEYFFEYGHTPALGSSVEPIQVGVLRGSGKYVQALEGLSPDSEYCYRAVVRGKGVEVRGAIMSFSTLPGHEPADLVGPEKRFEEKEKLLVLCLEAEFDLFDHQAEKLMSFINIAMQGCSAEAKRELDIAWNELSALWPEIERKLKLETTYERVWNQIHVRYFQAMKSYSYIQDRVGNIVVYEGK